MNKIRQTRPPNPDEPNSPKSGNPALDELTLLRHEVCEFKKDFKRLNNELSWRIAFGNIGSFVLISMLCGFLSLAFRN